MLTYRIYCLNRQDRITGAPIEAQFASDQDAIAGAREQIGDCASAEVWQLSRLVARVPGTPARPEGPGSRP